MCVFLCVYVGNCLYLCVCARVFLLPTVSGFSAFPLNLNPLKDWESELGERARSISELSEMGPLVNLRRKKSAETDVSAMCLLY